MNKIAQKRSVNYIGESLYRQNILTDPFEMFSEWFDIAAENGIEEPNAMILATAGKNNRPSARMVLLKEYDLLGFVFFTNYQSRKANELKSNPYGALLFPWHTIQKQVRIEGKIEVLPKSLSDDYFKLRPEGSKVGAWVSPQSSIIASREFLEKQVHKYMLEQKDQPIQRPPFWGGYKLIPDVFEFWQGRANRLHDRFEYIRYGNKWKIRRLAP